MKKLMMAGLVAGALMSGAPVAHAAAVQADCNFGSLAAEGVTGGQDTFTGAAYGYAVSDQPGAQISVHCEVRVNGGEVDRTPEGQTGQASFTAGQVTYTASDTDTVQLCAVWTSYNGTEQSGEQCAVADTQQIPPQEVVEASGLLDFLLCPIIASLSPGVPGVLDIDPFGDIAVAGIPIWDCPPYDV